MVRSASPSAGIYSEDGCSRALSFHPDQPLQFALTILIIMLKVKINMPEENSNPSPQNQLESVDPVIPETSNPISSESAPVTTQTQVVANGQPSQPTIPGPVTLAGQLATHKSSKWRYLFIVLGILQFLGVAVYFIIMNGISGQPGSEFIVLALAVTFVPVMGLVALINLIGLPIYLRKHKPEGRGLVLAVVSLVISIGLVLSGIFGVSIWRMAGTNYQSRSSELSKKNEQKEKQFLADNAKPEITKEEAVQLLSACKLKGFYYTNQTNKNNAANGGWGELSTTGVVLTKVDGRPYRISIADRLIPELVPIARTAQITCGDPQLWHDGSYEQYKDGKWYFKGEVVNDTRAGETKEEAINYMQSCKADYFVGYTDLSLVKDDSTKAWLSKAEESTSGIEISESAPKSYVFASKSMTVSLQDTARQFRQSCYNKKKLYLAVDDWIETEYPIGTWRRVKQ